MVVTKTEIQTLLDKIQRIDELGALTSTTFENLSDKIFAKTKTRISVSTLKRLWGYVNSKNAVRISTLDILCRYIGFVSFNDFQKQLDESNNSGFLNCDQVLSSSLKIGNLIEIGWQPNRLCKLVYEGDNQFVVKNTQNTSFTSQYIFKTPVFILKKPLYLEVIYPKPKIKNQKIYIAGKNTGLTILKVINGTAT